MWLQRSGVAERELCAESGREYFQAPRLIKVRIEPGPVRVRLDGVPAVALRDELEFLPGADRRGKRRERLLAPSSILCRSTNQRRAPRGPHQKRNGASEASQRLQAARQV